MREIKFRVCHLAQDGSKSIFYSDNERFRITLNGTVLEDYGTDDKEFWEEVFDANVFLQQYTGLKDSHGKEVYEGDIVKVMFTNIEHLGEVKYFPPMFYLLDGEDYEFNLYNYEYIEVIGNIFKNPELIK